MLYCITIVQKPTLHDRLRTSQNTRHITARDTPAVAITRAIKEVPLDRGTKITLAKHRGLLRALEAIDLSPLDTTVTSWSDLQARGVEVFEQHAQSNQHALSRDQFDSIVHAGTAGAGASGAFLRVIPELTTEAQSPLEIANNSVRTILQWAALSEKADAGLTRTVAKELPSSKQSTRDQYIGLVYNPDFFVLRENPAVHVAVDYSKLEEYAADIDKGLRGNDVYFGCPFRKNIPTVYQKMAATAARSGLL